MIIRHKNKNRKKKQFNDYYSDRRMLKFLKQIEAGKAEPIPRASQWPQGQKQKYMTKRHIRWNKKTFFQRVVHMIKAWSINGWSWDISKGYVIGIKNFCSAER